MTYVPRTDKTRWMRDQVLAALRAAPTGELNTTALSLATGVYSGNMQGVLLAMERHREVECYRTHTAEVYRWSLGPEAPPPVDVAALERLLDGVD